MAARSSRLLRDVRAVSPVIGTILMVAVGAALGAMVFVFVTHLTKAPPTPAPNVVLVKDEDQDHLTAPNTDYSADWSKIQITSPVHLHMAFNGVASSSSRDMPADTALSVSATPDRVDGGDRLDFCSPGLPAANVQVKVVYADPTSPQLLQDLSFTLVRACT